MKYRTISSLIVTLLLTSISSAQLSKKPFAGITKDGFSVTETPVCDYHKPASNYTVSKDCQHLAYIARKGNKVQAVLDGKPGKEYDSIDDSMNLVFVGPSDTLYYKAKNASGSNVIVIGNHETPANMIAGTQEFDIPFFFSDGKYWVYRAFGIGSNKNKYFIIANGKTITTQGQPYAYGLSTNGAVLKYEETLFGSSKGAQLPLNRTVIAGVPSSQYSESKDFQATPDMTNAVFTAYTGMDPQDKVNKRRVIWYKNKKFTELGPGSCPLLSPDGKRLIYNADPKFDYLRDQPDRRGANYVPVCILIDTNGKKQEIKNCWNPVFNHDGSKLAYVSRTAAGEQVVLDGKPGEPFKTIEDASLHFSPVSSRLAYVALPMKEKTKVLIVDGKKHPEPVPLNLTRDLKKLQVFSPEGKLIYRTRKRGKVWIYNEGKNGTTCGAISHLRYLKNGKFLYYDSMYSTKKRVVYGDSNRVYEGFWDCIVSPNQRHIAVIVYDGLRYKLHIDNSMRFFYVAASKKRPGRGHGKAAWPPCFPVKFTPDGDHIVSIFTDKYQRRYCLQIDGLTVYVANAFIGPDFAFTPDGKITAYAVKNNKIMKVVVEIKK